MKKKLPLLPLFKTFIRDSETGKRLKKNGERITKGSIDNYRYAYKNLEKFSIETGFELRVCDITKLTKRELTSEKNYWKKFYKKYTQFLYSNGCYDNYVGANVKQIRTFFNYLKLEKDINTGELHKLFYVRKETIDILVLSIDQLKFLIHDEEFHNSLSSASKRVKDAFVFGCTTGLRFSDIYELTSKNFEKQNNEWYLKVKSKKTKTYSYVKLPDYAVDIYKKYKPQSAKTKLFRKVSLFVFNRSLKEIGKKADFSEPVNIKRERQGKSKTLNGGKQLRFYDKMSSHMMRRTAITTLLILGVPEHLVRKISGHSNSSSSFNRYVHYAQAYIDKEIDKAHSKLNAI